MIALATSSGRTPSGAASSSTRPVRRMSGRAAYEHRCRHGERRDRVRPIESGDPDDGAGDHGRSEREEVRHEVAEAAFDVQVLAVRPRDLPDRDDVDRGACQRGQHDRRRVDVRRRRQPLHRLDDDQHAEHEQRDRVRLRREDLRPTEAERHASLGRPPREAGRPDRERERGRIDQHVRRVGEKRERVGEDPDDHLDAMNATISASAIASGLHLRIRAHSVVVIVVMRHGRSLPEMDGVVFVEIPAGSRNKYEWDEEAGGIVLDRRLFTSMSYPADYGFVEGTLAEDGDPLDALVLVGEPTFPGCRIRVRTVGVFHMADETGPDEKVLCVPLNDPSWSSISDIHDVPPQLRNEIEHFFQVYKDLEDSKKTETRGFGNRAEAQEIIAACRRRVR